MARLGLPLETFGGAEPVPALAAGSSAGCRWPRRWCATRRPRARRADVRPGPPRLRGPARRSSRAAGRRRCLVAATHDQRFVGRRRVAGRRARGRPDRGRRDARARRVIAAPRTRDRRSSTACSGGQPGRQARDRARVARRARATTIRLLPPVVLAAVAAGARADVGGIPAADLARRRGAALAGGARDRVLQHAVRRRQQRSGGGDGRSASARSGSRSRPLAAGVGLGLRVIAIACRRGRLLADHGLDPAGRLARPAGPRLAAVRVRRAGRLPGDPAVRRGPDHPAAGRRIRGLRGGWHPRLLVGVLVLRDPPRRPDGAGDGSPGVRPGPRSRLPRGSGWGILDVAIGAALAVVSIRALSLGRVLCPRHGGGPTRARKIVYVGGLLDDDNGRPTLTGGRGGRHARSAEALRPRWTRGAAEVAAVASARSDPREHPEELPAYLTRSLASEIIQIKNR